MKPLVKIIDKYFSFMSVACLLVFFKRAKVLMMSDSFFFLLWFMLSSEAYLKDVSLGCLGGTVG